MQDLYQSGADSDVKPNLESFQIAIEAWTKATDEPKALKRAQQIIDWMARLYLSSANDLAKPHTSCFHPILKGWAVSQRIEAPIISENLIQYMQHLQMDEGIVTAGPDTLCFNIVMSSWLKSKDINAERNIQRVFEYMDTCQKRGNHEVKPDSASYSIAISSIAPEITNYNYTSGARRADELLASVEKGCLAGDESLKPDTIMYNQVVNYWAKTQSEKGHYLKAREVLDRQIDIPKHIFKEKVTIELKRYGPTECFAFYPKAFISFLHKTIPASRVYTKEVIHSELKNSKFGEVSKNVSFKSPEGNVIRRAIVIRRLYLNT